jgi:hypothetical protein
LTAVGCPHFRIKCVELNRTWIAEELWELNAGSGLDRAGEDQTRNADTGHGATFDDVRRLQFEVGWGIFAPGISRMRARWVCQRLAGGKTAFVGMDMARHELSHHALKS